jgi:hypothetical protein
LTCDQRFGVTRAVESCKNDKLAERALALADLIADELATDMLERRAKDGGPDRPGPLDLLRDEAKVQSQATRLAWLFAPALGDLYDRRQWRDIDEFEATSPGARLVSSLVLAAARTGELITTDEEQQIGAFHAERRRRLSDYLLGRSCDAECKSRLVDFMLTSYAEAEGEYDQAMSKLLLRPRGESGAALGRLHARLLWCQIDTGDLAQLRDRVLAPTVAALAKTGGSQLVDIIDLLALAPAPPAGPLDKPWRAALAALRSAGEKHTRLFEERRAAARRSRQMPSTALRKIDFCTAAEIAPEPPVDAEDE